MNPSNRTDRTFSGQTIITRNNASDRPSTYNIRPSVRRNKNLIFQKHFLLFSRVHQLKMVMIHLVSFLIN